MSGCVSVGIPNGDNYKIPQKTRFQFIKVPGTLTGLSTELRTIAGLDRDIDHLDGINADRHENIGPTLGTFSL
jgi:hypothetical protein